MLCRAGEEKHCTGKLEISKVEFVVCRGGLGTKLKRHPEFFRLFVYGVDFQIVSL